MFGRQSESSLEESDQNLLNQAYCLYENRDYEKSGDIFRYLITKKPLHPTLWRGLASVYQGAGIFNAALNAWAVFSILNPQDYIAHYYAAHCYIALNNFKDALKALDLALEKSCPCDMIDTIKNMKDIIKNGS